MITIADDVFAWDEEGSFSNEVFVVTTPFDPQAVVAALIGPGQRLMLVGEDGVEYADAYEPARAGVYTANYMSDPEATDRGIEVYLDCKGAISDAMATTLRQVLREVLGAAVPASSVNAVIDHDE